MKELNLGPVANPDGSPTDLTREMLADTGRDPVAFAARRGDAARAQGRLVSAPDGDGRQFVMLVFIPAGHSEPEEKAVWTEGCLDIDHLAQSAIDDSWEAGDEPLEVRDFRGRSVWTNRRYGDLT